MFVLKRKAETQTKGKIDIAKSPQQLELIIA